MRERTRARDRAEEQTFQRSMSAERGLEFRV